MTDSWTRSQMLKVALKHPISPEKEISNYEKADITQREIITNNSNISKEFIDHHIKKSPNDAAVDMLLSKSAWKNFSPDHLHEIMTSDRVHPNTKQALAYTIGETLTGYEHLAPHLSRYTDHEDPYIARIAERHKKNASNSESR